MFVCVKETRPTNYELDAVPDTNANANANGKGWHSRAHLK